MASAPRPFLPPPPRFTGDASADSKIVIEWFHQFYQYNTSDPGTFDGDNLVQPTAATVSTAQQTANEAYELAQNLEARVTALENP